MIRRAQAALLALASVAVSAGVLVAGCSSDHNGGAGWPSAPAWGPLPAAWTWTSPGKPDTAMERRDTPGGIPAWVPTVWYRAAPDKFDRYLRALDELGNEIGMQRWHDAGGVGDPPPGAIKGLHDLPAGWTVEVVFCPRIKAIHYRDSIFFAGLTDYDPFRRYVRIYLTWPSSHDEHRMEDVIMHETSHALGLNAAHDPASCKGCRVDAL